MTTYSDPVFEREETQDWNKPIEEGGNQIYLNKVRAVLKDAWARDLAGLNGFQGSVRFEEARKYVGVWHSTHRQRALFGEELCTWLTKLNGNKNG
jgi:hypothetical protein